MLRASRIADELKKRPESEESLQTLIEERYGWTCAGELAKKVLTSWESPKRRTRKKMEEHVTINDVSVLLCWRKL